MFESLFAFVLILVVIALVVERTLEARDRADERKQLLDRILALTNPQAHQQVTHADYLREAMQYETQRPAPPQQHPHVVAEQPGQIAGQFNPMIQ